MQRGLEGTVFKLSPGSTKDGPGLRYVVYLKGCNFSCLYCGNPESWSPGRTVMIHEERLRDAEAAAACPSHAIRRDAGGYRVDRGLCGACRSFDCAEACFDGSIEVVGETRRVDEIVADAVSYRGFFGRGGGVTLTGGEPTLQWGFYVELLRGLKGHGLHTAVETNGSHPRLVDSLEYVDLVICDLKHMDEAGHRRLTGRSNRQTLRNIRAVCDHGTPLWVRIPVIPTVNDSDENIGAAAEFLAPMRDRLCVELLAYNRLGVYKWRALGKRYPLEGVNPPTAEEMTRLAERIGESGIRVIRT